MARGKQSFYLTVEGDDALRAKLAKLRGLAAPTLAAALFEEAEAVGLLAVTKYVPKDTGVLAGSWYVKPPVATASGVRVVFGFGGGAVKYAWVTHENKRAGKTKGVSPSGRRYKHWADVGQWHFLEVPLALRGRRFSRTIGARISRAWSSLLT